MTLLRGISLSLGIVCWIALLLVQSDEERLLRNRLVEWWLAVSETGERATAVTRKISNSFARGSLAVLEFLSGPRTVSIKLFCVSLAVLSILPLFHSAPGRLFWASVTASAVVCWVASSKVTARAWRVILSLPLLVSFLLFLTKEPIPLATYFLTGFTVIGVAVGASRYLLRRATSVLGAILGLAVLVVLPLATGVATFLTVRFYYWESALAWLRSSDGPIIGAPVGGLLTAVIYSTVVGAGFGGMVFLVPLGLVTNSIVWQVLSRSLNTLHTYWPTRRNVFAFSLLLIGVGIADAPSAWVAKWFGLPAP